MPEKKIENGGSNLTWLISLTSGNLASFPDLDNKLSRLTPSKTVPGSRDFNSKNFLKPNLNSRVYKQYRFALHTTSAVL